MADETNRRERTAEILPAVKRPDPLVLDSAIGIGVQAIRLSSVAVNATRRVAQPLSAVLLRPPLVPKKYWPQTRLIQLAERGQVARQVQAARLAELVNELVPLVLNAVLDRIDLTQLVLDRVVLQRIIEAVDIDAVAARIDLDPIVDRVPIQRVLDRVDVDEVVASVDLEAVINRIDIDAIAAKIDIDAIIGRLDLAGLAREVIDEIDLPEIIRDSSGAMASETVVGLRMRGIEADERVNRIVDRIVLRRRGRNTDTQARTGHDDTD
ncbi:hypothetical protein ACSMXN_08815 [Jatrophihabitans sp. DSM 45814]